MAINNSRQKDFGTLAIANFIRNKGITIVSISKNTGISYDKLRRSFRLGRPLTADELLAVCSYLEVDPMVFHIKKKSAS